MKQKQLIKGGKFKGMDKRDIVPFLQAQENLKPKFAVKKRPIDKQLNKTYNNWQPKQDLFRSFFIWHGMRSKSFKEMEIAAILKNMNLRYFREVSFDMIKRFDFYIPLIDLVIEYDGRQHFKELREIKNDIFKEDQLTRLGIKLIRYNKKHDLQKQIPYDLIYHPVLQ